MHGLQLMTSCFVVMQSEALSKGAEKLLHRYVVSAGKAFKHLAVSTMTGVQSAHTASQHNTSRVYRDFRAGKCHRRCGPGELL
jgi:hypothetical protein